MTCSRLRALDLFCRAGGVSEGLLRAGFEVVGVDILDCSKAYNRGPGNSDRHERPATFIQANAMEFPLEGFDFIWASPPCQAHTILRRINPHKEHPDLIPATRERLAASGVPYVIENVPGAPLGGQVLMLCGSMFGLQTQDGRAELRRHRLFETSWPIALRPACQHGYAGESLTVTGTGMGPGNRGKEAEQAERREQRVICVAGGKAMSGGMMTSQGELKRLAVLTIAGDHPSAKIAGKFLSNGSNLRERFSTDAARHAMGIDWMAMKDLSQAIPPVYAEFLGGMFLGEHPVRLLVSGGCQVSLF